MYRKYLKRIIDLLLALCALIILLPLFFAAAILIKADSKGPVFFKQKRAGMNNKPFIILKFRTMYTDCPHKVPTDKLKNPERYITGIGKWMRQLSIDEIPQLINIVLGSMSFVGPRPALFNQEELLRAREKNGAVTVRPGLTGLAQISGRDNLSSTKKAELDGEYAKKMSLVYDIKIILKTALCVLKREGISEGEAPERSCVQ